MLRARILQCPERGFVPERVGLGPRQFCAERCGLTIAQRKVAGSVTKKRMTVSIGTCTTAAFSADSGAALTLFSSGAGAAFPG